MEEYTWDASGSYLREDSCYFFRIDEKTLFWQKCQNRVYLQSERGCRTNDFFVCVTAPLPLFSLLVYSSAKQPPVFKRTNPGLAHLC